MSFKKSNYLVYDNVFMAQIARHPPKKNIDFNILKFNDMQKLDSHEGFLGKFWRGQALGPAHKVTGCPKCLLSVSLSLL